MESNQLNNETEIMDFFKIVSVFHELWIGLSRICFNVSNHQKHFEYNSFQD